MFDLRLTIVVGIGAALGGIARLLVTQLVLAKAGPGFGPVATMFINITGSFLIGVVIETAQARAGFPTLMRFFLTTGILGGYTTFSTFSLEALALGTAGPMLTAGAYTIGSVVLGILAAFGGIATARAFAP